MVLKKDTLTERQTESLLVYKQELKEKIYGPKVSVEKITWKGRECLESTIFDSEKPTIRKDRLYSKEELDVWIKRLWDDTIPASLIKGAKNIYTNMLYTYGSVENSFKENGRENPISKRWKEHVFEYLGILPDYWIAEIVGVSEQDVVEYRIFLKINTVENNLFNPKLKRFDFEYLILQQKGFNICMYMSKVRPLRKK